MARKIKDPTLEPDDRNLSAEDAKVAVAVGAAVQGLGRLMFTAFNAGTIEEVDEAAKDATESILAVMLLED